MDICDILLHGRLQEEIVCMAVSCAPSYVDLCFIVKNKQHRQAELQERQLHTSHVDRTKRGKQGKWAEEHSKLSGFTSISNVKR